MKISGMQFVMIKMIIVIIVFVFDLSFMYGLYNTVDDQITRLDNPTTEQIRQVQELIQHFQGTVLIISVVVIGAVFLFPYMRSNNVSKKSNKDKDTVGIT